MSDNIVTTHTDTGWWQRINVLVGKLSFDQPIDPKTTNRFELEAAKLVIRWNEQEVASPKKPELVWKTIGT